MLVQGIGTLYCVKRRWKYCYPKMTSEHYYNPRCTEDTKLCQDAMGKKKTTPRCSWKNILRQDALGTLFYTKMHWQHYATPKYFRKTMIRQDEVGTLCYS